MNRQAATYAILGNGRVARHLCHYFQLLAIPFVHWHRSQNTLSLCETIRHCSHVIVAISDAHIESLINNLNKSDKIFIHCSGALCSDAAWTAHPLQTFSWDLYTLECYQDIPFIIEKEGPAFDELFPQLNNPFYSIHRKQKPYYHALCVMANNFTTLLWQKAFNAFENILDIDHHALLPILKQTCYNLITCPDNALTGPIARDDTHTIKSNLAALEKDEFYDIYKAFIANIKTHAHT